MPYKKGPKSQRVAPGIVKTGPNRFLIQTRWTDHTGRRRLRQATAKTLPEALALQQELRGEEAPQRVIRERFGDFATRWLVEHESRYKRSSAERYTTEIAHACAAFGTVYVDALKPPEIRRWVSDMVKDCAPHTINGRLRVLRQVLETALEDGLIRENPARKVRGLPEKRTKGKRGTALTAGQLRTFVRTTRDMARAGELSEDIGRMLLTLAFTGMRRGECLALRWDDWVGDELHIERAIWRGIEQGTKTDDPRRVSVVGPFADILKEQKLWLEEIEHPGRVSGLIFPASPRHARAAATRRGQKELSWFRSGSTLDTPIARVVRASGVPEISCHSFRRTWEDLLRRAGVDDLVRRSMAGWRTDDAQAIYAGIDKSERAEATLNLLRMVVPTGSPGGSSMKPKS